MISKNWFLKIYSLINYHHLDIKFSNINLTTISEGYLYHCSLSQKLSPHRTFSLFNKDRWSGDMRGRFTLFILPIIVLHIFILLPLTYSRPSKRMPLLFKLNNNNNINFEWTSVERVSRSIKRDNEMKDEEQQKHRIAVVSKEIIENDENDVAEKEIRRKEYVNVETNFSQDLIKKFGKETFDLLKKSNNDKADVNIDSPLKTDEMRINEWEKHHKKKGHQKAPEWFNSRKNDTEIHGCVASPFSQRIHIAECETKYILNRYCHGACASIYIPELRSKKLKAVFSNCLVCRPAEVEHIQVRLECPKGPIVRDVMRVKRCECQQFDAPLPS